MPTLWTLFCMMKLLLTSLWLTGLLSVIYLLCSLMHDIPYEIGLWLLFGGNYGAALMGVIIYTFLAS